MPWITSKRQAAHREEPIELNACRLNYIKSPWKKCSCLVRNLLGNFMTGTVDHMAYGKAKSLAQINGTTVLYLALVN